MTSARRRRRRVRPLGMNARNAHIARHNGRKEIRLVKDKVATKERLAADGIAVPPTLMVVTSPAEVRPQAWDSLPDRFVVKPSCGSQGRGVLVAVGRTPNGWSTPSGSIGPTHLCAHVTDILDGEHSSTTHDVALFEPLLQSHRDLAALAPAGLPDVRVVCDGKRPVLAMMRIPTSSSGGRGNLHQGGVGAALDLSNGTVQRAVVHGREIAHHPDTGVEFARCTVPDWDRVIDLARRCGPALGLRYVGVDLVIDAELGPLVLEVNSHPGLEIQNVCRAPITLDRP